jgi:hypothetical protein
LRSLQISWSWTFWKNPEFEFAHSGFIDYLVTRKIPFPVALVEKFRNEKWFVEKTGLCSIEYASTMSNIAVQDLDQLLRYSLLRSCTWEYARCNIQILEIEKLLKLKQQWSVGWSVEEASTWLGVSKQTVTQLIKLGLLADVQRTKNSKSRLLLSCQSVKNFFEKITNQLQWFEDDPRKLISLSKAKEYFTHRGVDGAVLLQLAANGVLPVFKLQKEVYFLNHICFSLASVYEISDVILGRKDFISADGFAQETGISKRLIQKWIKVGLLKPAMKIRFIDYFQRSDLNKFANERFSN